MVALLKRLLSAKEIAAAIGGSEPTVWRLAANGTLPKSIKISKGMTRWDAAEIEAWIESKKAARSDNVQPDNAQPVAALIQRGRNPVPPSIRPDARKPGRPRKVAQEAMVPA